MRVRENAPVKNMYIDDVCMNSRVIYRNLAVAKLDVSISQRLIIYNKIKRRRHSARTPKSRLDIDDVILARSANAHAHV